MIRKIRSAILEFLTHRLALPLLKIFRRTNPFPYTKEELSQFEHGSLGRDLFLFLESRKLNLLSHYARHDMKHILLDYDTTDEGEACLQAFMLGNGRISFPVLATVLYSFLTMPEYWNRIRKAFLQGRRSAPIHRWDWNSLLTTQTDILKQRIKYIHHATA